MKKPSTLVFVCQNVRDENDPVGSCTRRGSRDVLTHMKAVREQLGLKRSLRVLGSTCLGPCQSGVNMVVVDHHGYAYYGRMTPELGEALVREHILAGEDGPELAKHRLPPNNLLDLSALGEPPPPGARDP